MSTTINFAFSADMQATLSGGGVVYVLVFGAATSTGTPGYVTSTAITDFAAGGSINIANALYSGQVFIVASQGPQASGWESSFANGNDLMSAVVSSSALTMQILELTLSDNAADQGDVTAINYAGLNVSMAITYSDGTTQVRGSALTTDQLFAAAEAATGGTGSVLQWGNPTLFGTPGRLVYGPAAHDPAAATPLTAWDPAAWLNYVTSLAQSPDVLEQIQIVAMFNGGTTLQADGMLSEYRIEFVYDPAHPGDVGHGYFRLVPVTDNGATNIYYIHIPFQDMVDNIYAQTGTVSLYDQNGNFIRSETSFTPNDAVGTVTRVLVAGFDAGFWGAEGHSLFADGTAVIDFNQTYNWDVGYAYGGALIAGSGSATYVNQAQPASGIYYDPFAALISTNTNYYGYSYSDLLSAGGVNPQIPLYDSGTSANVATINVTVYAPNDTASLAGSYTPYAPMQHDGFVAPDGSTFDGTLIFSFSFSGGSGSSTLYQPSAETPVTLRIFDPSTGTFSDVVLSGTYTPPGGGAAVTSPWNYYVLEPGTSGGWTHQPIQNYYGNGGFALIDLPISASGATYYQLVFGAEGEQTIYNFYFDPTLPEGQQVRIDHGVGITFTAAGGNYTLNFAPGGALLYDIDTLSAPGNHEGQAGVTITGSPRDDFINMVLTVQGQPLATSRDDIIGGGGGNDHIAGLGGNDTLDGGTGVDSLSGGEGNDILIATAKASVFDAFNGGAGTDTLKLVGNKSVTLSGFDAGASDIERIEGNRVGILGTNSADTFDLSALTAIANVTFIDAAEGNDRLIGSNFADMLRGNDGDDFVSGLGGNDVIDGGENNDILTGGAGHDIFIYGRNYGADTIADFNFAEDRINLTAFRNIESIGDLSMRAEGSSVVIDFGNGQTLTIEHAELSDFSADDFIFASGRSAEREAGLYSGDWIFG